MSKQEAIKDNRWGVWEFMDKYERYEYFCDLEDIVKTQKQTIRKRNLLIKQLRQERDNLKATALLLSKKLASKELYTKCSNCGLEVKLEKNIFGYLECPECGFIVE